LKFSKFGIGLKMTNKKIALFTLMGLAISAPIQAFACASCGCTLSSDWENLGFSSTSGFKIDVRYDYLNQNELRTGTHSISRSAAGRSYCGS
jgi:hypothetical protein